MVLANQLNRSCRDCDGNFFFAESMKHINFSGYHYTLQKKQNHVNKITKNCEKIITPLIRLQFQNNKNGSSVVLL